MLKLVLPLVVLIAVVAAVTLVALGNDDSGDSESGVAPTVTASPTSGNTGGNGDDDDAEPTAEEVLNRAAEALTEVESFHFVLTHENGSTPLPLNLQLTTAEGDVEVPASLRAEVEAEVLGVNVGVDVISIDDKTWITNPFTRRWEELDANIRDFADPVILVSDLIPSITPTSLTDGGRVDGVETHLVRGTLDSGALSDALGIAEPGRDVDVEAWIGVDDDLPRRIRLIGPLSDADDEDVIREVEVSRIDEPVEIMPPE